MPMSPRPSANASPRQPAGHLILGYERTLRALRADVRGADAGSCRAEIIPLRLPKTSIKSGQRLFSKVRQVASVTHQLLDGDPGDGHRHLRSDRSEVIGRSLPSAAARPSAK